MTLADKIQLIIITVCSFLATIVAACAWLYILVFRKINSISSGMVIFDNTEPDPEKQPEIKILRPGKGWVKV